MKHLLVLFDLDGTLLWSHGGGRAALCAALESVYGTAQGLDAIYHGGRTAEDIFRTVLERAGLDPVQIEAGRAALYARLIENVEAAQRAGEFNADPCPGAPEVVRRLSAHEGVLPGVLTGNPRGVAQIKLAQAGYRVDDFCCGAYGEESRGRAGLVALALARAGALVGHAVSPTQAVIVGDTLRDIAAARESGCRAVAVATGDDPPEALRDAQPDALFETMADPEAVVRAVLSIRV